MNARQGGFMNEAGTQHIDRTILNSKGFTILEILAVIVILGMLYALVATQFTGKVDQARQVDAQAQIELLGQALDLYRLEKGKYPTSEEGLKTIEPYLKKQLPKDPWGFEFHYKSPGDHGEYDLVSYGADNAEGGEGNDMDIVSWKNLEKN